MQRVWGRVMCSWWGTWGWGECMMYSRMVGGAGWVQARAPCWQVSGSAQLRVAGRACHKCASAWGAAAF